LIRTPITVLTTGKITTGKIKSYSRLAGYVFWRVQITTGKITTGKKQLIPKQSAGNNVVPVPAKIWRELAPYYFPADYFKKKIDPKTIRRKIM
jgi:hypothetical protein